MRLGEQAANDGDRIAIGWEKVSMASSDNMISTSVPNTMAVEIKDRTPIRVRIRSVLRRTLTLSPVVRTSDLYDS